MLGNVKYILIWNIDISIETSKRFFSELLTNVEWFPLLPSSHLSFSFIVVALQLLKMSWLIMGIQWTEDASLDKNIKTSDLWRTEFESENPHSIEDNFKIDEPTRPKWCRFCWQEFCSQWRPQNQLVVHIKYKGTAKISWVMTWNSRRPYLRKLGLIASNFNWNFN